MSAESYIKIYAIRQHGVIAKTTVRYGEGNISMIVRNSISNLVITDQRLGQLFVVVDDGYHNCWTQRHSLWLDSTIVR